MNSIPYHLVTGGAGFIGSHVAKHLLRSGERVLILLERRSQRPPGTPWHETLERRQVSSSSPRFDQIESRSIEPDGQDASSTFVQHVCLPCIISTSSRARN